MAFLERQDPLRSFLTEIAADEGLTLYDAERLGRGGLRVWVDRAPESRTAAGSGTATTTARGSEFSEKSAVAAGVFSGGVGLDAIDHEAELREEIAAADPSDSAGGSRGVTVGECSRLCRRLMVVFQAEGSRFGLPGEPEIEVSSPGVNRLLRLEEHFRDAVGQRMRAVIEGVGGVEAVQPDGESAGRKGSRSNGSRRSETIVGVLEHFSGGVLTICTEPSGEKMMYPLEDVKRAQIDFRFG